MDLQNIIQIVEIGGSSLAFVITCMSAYFLIIYHRKRNIKKNFIEPKRQKLKEETIKSTNTQKLIKYIELSDEIRQEIFNIIKEEKFVVANMTKQFFKFYYENEFELLDLIHKILVEYSIKHKIDQIHVENLNKKFLEIRKIYCDNFNNKKSLKNKSSVGIAIQELLEIIIKNIDFMLENMQFDDMERKKIDQIIGDLNLLNKTICTLNDDIKANKIAIEIVSYKNSENLRMLEGFVSSYLKIMEFDKIINLE